MFPVLATSCPNVKKRLYVVGAGDLGTSAFVLNESLEEIFDITTSWKAIVLIDEVSAVGDKH